MKEGGKQVGALMMKDLRLPCESGIKNALQERLITVARTDSYLCERADAYLMREGEKKRIIEFMHRASHGAIHPLHWRGSTSMCTVRK